MRVEIITAPTVEPVLLPDAKTYCRVDPDLTTEDVLITSLIKAARHQLELETGRAFAVQTVRAVFDHFPIGLKFLPLPRAPLISVDSVKYVDADHAEQTLDAALYTVETAVMPGGIYIKGNWPLTRERSPGAVRVEYQCGYSTGEGGASEPIPENAKVAILYAVNHWYENRETVIVGSIATPLPMAAAHLARSLKIHYNAPDVYTARPGDQYREKWR